MESFVLPLALNRLGYCSVIVDEKAVCEALMESEFKTLIGAAKHERSEERVDYRNGYKGVQAQDDIRRIEYLHRDIKFSV